MILGFPHGRLSGRSNLRWISGKHRQILSPKFVRCNELLKALAGEMSCYLEMASQKRCPGRPVPHFPKGIQQRAFCKDFRKRLETRTLESDRLRVNLVTSISCKIEEKG